MKKYKLLPFFLFFALMITSCVSQRPQYTSIQDGVRCPLPNQKIASNTKPSNRAPASETLKPNDQVCDQLFGE